MNKKKRPFKILEYPAIFDFSKDGEYDVSFPDFPGCVTFGKNFEEAKKKAAEVLELWLEELKENKQSLPVRIQRPIIDSIRVYAPR